MMKTNKTESTLPKQATTKLYETTEAAEFLGLKPTTLESWRVKGGKLPFLKIGRLVKYAESDLIAFIEQSKRTSTTEHRAA
jgi:excisionase family DNA binding protein